MSEEDIGKTEENKKIESQEETVEETSPEPERRRFFTRRNAGIALGIAAISAVLLVLLVTVSYRYGVFDNYIKAQFVAKMQAIGIDFSADVFRVTVNPLQLELKNATFNDRKTGEKLFFISEAEIGLTVQDLYAWQLSRDLTVDSTEINGAEVWVRFDENGNSNFSNLQFVEEAPGYVNFNYTSAKFSLAGGLIHFGDAQHDISGDAKNVIFSLEPVDASVPDEQKRYRFDLTATDSNFVYDESRVEPIDVRAQGITDRDGAEITSLKLTSPLGETTLAGNIEDWETIKYNFKIDSTVDLTQTSTVFPLGTPLRGIGNFSGTVTGAGENYKIDGEITSENLQASNIYLRALNVTATVEGTNSMYDANGKAIAELLTFEDFRIEFPQLIGNVRGTGTDFRWVGELQAAAAKSPLGSIGGLYITDSVAEYKDSKLDATLGNLRSRSFFSEDATVENLQARNVRINSDGETTNVTAPNLRASTVKTEDATLRGVNAGNIKLTNRNGATDADIGTFRAENLDTKDARLKNLSANNVKLRDSGNATNVTANNVQAESLNAEGANIGNLTASNARIQIADNETLVHSDNLKIAKVETDAAVLGSLNIAGVRLTIRQGRVEARSGDIDAGAVALTKSAVPEGGRLENVKIYKPVFVLEPSGRYRASADMSLGGGVLGSISLGAARASVVLNNDRVELNNLTANVMEGDLRGEATIAFNNRNRSQINAEFSNLDLGKILALQGGRVIPIDGQTTGNVNLTFAGKDFRTASGNLTADITANAGTADRGLVPVNGRVEATATNGLFNLDLARLNTANSQLNATGSLDLNGYNSNLNIALNSTDAKEVERIVKVLNLSPELEQRLEEYQVEIAGNLNFNGTMTGNISKPTIDGRASLDSISLRGRALGSVTTDIAYSPDGIELRNGLLKESDGGTLAFNVNAPSSGTNNISVQATLDKINIGNILAALPVQLPETLRSLQADTSGTVNLSGLPGAMEGEANITATGGTIEGQTFDNLQARATFAGNLVNLERFEAKFGEGFLRANGIYQTDTTEFNFDVTGNDIQIARIRPFIPNNQSLPDINGIVNLTAKATGRGEDSTTYNVNFNGTGREIFVNGNALGEVTFNGVTENQRLNANLTANLNGQQQAITATVNFADPNLPFRAETTFNNTELAPLIALVRPQGDNPVQVGGQATGTVFIEGNLSSVDASGKRTINTDNLRGSAQFSQFSLQIGDTPLVATEPVSVTFNAREVTIESARFSGGGSNVVASGTVALAEGAVNNLAIDGRVNLSVFNAVSPNYFFAGLADVNVRLTGSNSDPRLNGTAEFQNASASAFVGTERLTVQRIQGRVLFNTNQAQIAELTGFLGGGRVTAEGGALLDGLSLRAFRLSINGNNITAPLPEDFITTGDAEIEVTGRREGNALNTFISGTFNARRSLYTENIDLADIIGSRRSASIAETGSSGGVLGTTRLSLRVVGRDALVVRNNLADLTASIDLQITGDTENPQVAGRISANEGTIFFRDDRYEVLRGELVFPPNTQIEPIINLQAETEISGYQILVNLNGSLTDTENLNATVRSNPALPQADVISLITTGNLSNSDTGIPTLAQSGINTAAEILTDEIINKPLGRATDKLFGLNVFELDPIISGQRLNPTARLTVGRQINRNLLITYSTNLSEDQNQVLALEYRVSNRLSFIAQYEQRSLSNVTRRNNAFSFEIRLRKRF